MTYSTSTMDHQQHSYVLCHIMLANLLTAHALKSTHQSSLNTVLWCYCVHMHMYKHTCTYSYIVWHYKLFQVHQMSAATALLQNDGSFLPYQLVFHLSGYNSTLVILVQNKMSYNKQSTYIYSPCHYKQRNYYSKQSQFTFPVKIHCSIIHVLQCWSPYIQ